MPYRLLEYAVRIYLRGIDLFCFLEIIPYSDLTIFHFQLIKSEENGLGFVEFAKANGRSGETRLNPTGDDHTTECAQLHTDPAAGGPANGGALDHRAAW